MNTQNWVRGTIALVCWLLGSAVPAAPPAASAALTEPPAMPAGAAPAAAEDANNRDQLVVLVRTTSPDGEEVPVDDAIVTLFIGEASQRHLTKDGKTKFSLPVDTQEEATQKVTLRVAGTNLKTRQITIPSLHDAAGQPHKMLMEKLDTALTDDH